MSVGDAFLAQRIQEAFDRQQAMDEKLDLVLEMLGEFMATAAEQLNALNVKLDDLIADVQAALATLNAERENLTTPGQAALDSITAKVAAFDAEIGDADGSDTPVPTP